MVIHNEMESVLFRLSGWCVFSVKKGGQEVTDVHEVIVASVVVVIIKSGSFEWNFRQ